MIFLLYYQHLLFVKASLEKILLLLSPQNKPDKMARDVLLESSLLFFVLFASQHFSPVPLVIKLHTVDI